MPSSDEKIPSSGEPSGRPPAEGRGLPVDVEGGRRHWARLATKPIVPLIAIVIVLLLSIPHFHSLFRDGPREGPPGGVGPPPAPPGNWPVFLDIWNNTTLRDRDLAVRGDIIVRENASLEIVSCNVTMNGTVHVLGRLGLRGSTFQGLPDREGFTCPYDNCRLVMVANLTGCRWARLNFTADYRLEKYQTVRLDVTGANGTAEGVWVTSGGPAPVTEEVTIDLAGSCGEVVELAFVTNPGKPFGQFNLVGPELLTDRFRTVTSDLIRVRQSQDWRDWHENGFSYPFQIRGDGGRIDIDGCSFTVPSRPASVVRAVNSTVSVSASTFAQAEPAEYMTAFLQLRSSVLEMDDCKMVKGIGLNADDARARIADCHFWGQYEAISVTNSDLTVDGCSLEDCETGIAASAKAAGGRGGVFMNGTSVESASLCVLLDNLPATVTGCRLAGQVPLAINPPENLSRADCSMARVARIEGNTLVVPRGSSGEERAAAINLFSAIPVPGMERLVLSNALTAAQPVARYLRLNLTGIDTYHQWTSLEYHGTGKEVTFDAWMEPAGEGRHDTGWIPAQQRGHDYPHFSPFIGRYYIYSNQIPMERMLAVNGSRVLQSLDEGAIEFRLETPDQFWTWPVDVRALQHPGEVLQLGPPGPPPCDLSLLAPGVDFSLDPSFLNITVPVDIKGPAFPSVNITCTIDGREPGGWVNACWLDGWISLELDTRAMVSGELVLRAVPEGVEDVDPEDNELAFELHQVDRSCSVANERGPGGIWILQPNVSLALENCDFSKQDGGIWFLGLGNNRFEAGNCSFNCSSVLFGVEQGALRDTELRPPLYGNSHGVDEYLTRVQFFGGSWELDNVTGGCRADEFGTFRGLLLENLESYQDGEEYLPGRSGGVTIAAETEAFSMKNSSFLVYTYTEIRGNISLSVQGSTFAQMASLVLRAPSISLEGNRFEAVYYLELEGNITARRNLFRSCLLGVRANLDSGSCLFEDNAFTSDMVFEPSQYPTHQFSHAALQLSGRGQPVLSNNSFHHFQIAMSSDGPEQLADPAGDNRFSDIGRVIWFHQKTATLEVDYRGLCLFLNRAVSELDVKWNDQLYDWNFGFSCEWLVNGGIASKEVTVIDRFVDPNGTHRRNAGLNCTLTARSPSGAVYTHDLALTVREEDNWTVRMEYC